KSTYLGQTDVHSQSKSDYHLVRSPNCVSHNLYTLMYYGKKPGFLALTKDTFYPKRPSIKHQNPGF
ncbi:MAG: hypothetical protein KDJ52_14265, partial [Anaerolineae bacterium]|nr:hypothetical protein [Anaerolineae bacterium]